jgi:ATP-dependent Clp protease protease subunit
MGTVEFRARGNRGEIWLYDQIGASMFSDGVTAKQFQKELSALGKVNTINLRINSPGGNVFEGLAIYNQLAQHPARIEVNVDGVAASIASVIAMSGDLISMAKNSMMMIHDPSGFAVGNADEMERVAALLRQVKGNLTSTYADRTGQKAEQINQWMSEETWFTADTAVENGFADTIVEPQPVTALFDLSQYRNAPKDWLVKLQNKVATPAKDIRAVRLSVMEKRMREICV